MRRKICAPFCVRRKDEERHNGDDRTKRVILEIYDAMAGSIRTGRPYETILDPPPPTPAAAIHRGELHEAAREFQRAKGWVVGKPPACAIE